MITTRQKYNSLNYMKLFCAVLVIVGHTSPLSDINDSLGFIALRIMPRIAVPFFFAVAGYFYIKRLLNSEDNLKKHLKSLITVYMFWSVIYYVDDIVRLIATGGSLFSLIKSFLVDFFITGTSYHFWFFPALIYSYIAVSIFNRFKLLKPLAVISIIFYFVGVFGMSYYGIGSKIPVLNKLYDLSYFTSIRRILLQGFPFFMIGYFINRYEYKLKEMKNKRLIPLTAAFAMLLILEIIFVSSTSLQRGIILNIFVYPLLFFVFILSLNNPLPDYKNADVAKKIATFTFYSHPLCITLLIAIFPNINATPLFISTTIIVVVCGYFISRVNVKLINNLLL